MIRPRHTLPPTARQVEVCECIAALSAKRPPTVRELAYVLGIASTNGVHCHLASMRAKGLVEPATGDGSTRDIFLTPKGWGLAGGSPRMTESEAAAAYVLDRAAQYESGSGVVTALENIAVALARCEHLEAEAHGELGDLREAADDDELQAEADTLEGLVAQ